MTIFLILLQFILSLIALMWAAERFVYGATEVAERLHISKAVIGATLVAVGTSLPEALVSVMAGIHDTPEIALGNGIGSNIANIGLIIGICALYRPVDFDDSNLFNLKIMLGTAIILLFVIFDLSLTRFDAILLAILYFVPFIYSIYAGRVPPPEATVAHPGMGRAIFWILLGGIVLPVAADFLIVASTEIARLLNVSETVIGLTLVALGTSLPELATCLVSLYKNEHGIVIGNILGSNVFNITLVLGLTSIITPFSFDATVLNRDYLVMLLFSLVLTWYLIGRTRLIKRWQGFTLLVMYLLYMLLLLSSV